MKHVVIVGGGPAGLTAVMSYQKLGDIRLLSLQKPRQFLVAHSVFLCDNYVVGYCFSQFNYTKKARQKLRFSGFFLAFSCGFRL